MSKLSVKSHDKLALMFTYSHRPFVVGSGWAQKVSATILVITVCMHVSYFKTL